jgi:hypothetical protein
VFDPRAELAQLREQKAEQTLAENWQRYYAQLKAPQQAWADLLSRQPWHWFVTLTFRREKEQARGGIHPEKADKSFRMLISSINADLYGKKWHKHPGGGIVWARGQEFHKDGHIHFHALAACETVDLNEVSRRLDWMDWWWERNGIARIERPESQGDVCGYISKYVVSDGEVDLSNNFGRIQPPSLFPLDEGTSRARVKE